jgi:hypothetical protein
MEMGLKVFNVIIWTLAGVLTLMGDEVGKFTYGVTWATLMMYVVSRCFEN